MADTKRIVWELKNPNDVHCPIFQDGCDFQRDDSESKIKAIVDSYNELRFGTPEAFFWDGRLWAWDGQNRTKVARHKGFESVMYRVAYGYTPQEVADAFADQGVGRTNVAPKDVYRAKVFAAVPLFLSALHVLEANGYTLEFQRHGRGIRRNTWNAHRAVYEIAKAEGGMANLGMVCEVLRASWGDCEPSTAFLGGLGTFVRRYRGHALAPPSPRDFFFTNLVKILTKYSEPMILRLSRNQSGAAKDRVARMLVSLYNTNRTTYKLSGF